MSTDPPLQLVVWSANHRSAPVEVRERLAFRADRLTSAVRELASAPGVREAAILSTCNRVELYAVGPDKEALHREIEAFLEQYHGIEIRALDGLLQWLDGDQAAQHLFRVAASLESMVLGEAEILGQVKDAYQCACEAGGAGPTLRVLFETSFFVAKEVRSNTRIGHARVSVASAAVELAGKVFEGFGERRIVVVGTGEMAAGIVESLRAAGARRIAVTGRHAERAAAFAARFGAETFDADRMGTYVAEADIVLVGTASPRYLLTYESVTRYLRGRGGRPLLVIDISVPRNVDPRLGQTDDCYLYNIDDLQEIAHRNRAERDAAAAEADPLVDRGLRRYRARVAQAASSEVIGHVRSAHENIRQAVLQAEAARLAQLEPATRERIERASQRLTQKVIHAVLNALSEERSQAPDALSWTLHATADQVFHPGSGFRVPRSGPEGGKPGLETGDPAAGGADSQVWTGVRSIFAMARDGEQADASGWSEAAPDADREAFSRILSDLAVALAMPGVRAVQAAPDDGLADRVIRLYTHYSAEGVAARALRAE